MHTNVLRRFPRLGHMLSGLLLATIIFDTLPPQTGASATGRLKGRGREMDSQGLLSEAVKYKAAAGSHGGPLLRGPRADGIGAGRLPGPKLSIAEGNIR